MNDIVVMMAFRAPSSEMAIGLAMLRKATAPPQLLPVENGVLIPLILALMLNDCCVCENRIQEMWSLCLTPRSAVGLVFPMHSLVWSGQPFRSSFSLSVGLTARGPNPVKSSTATGLAMRQRRLKIRSLDGSSSERLNRILCRSAAHGRPMLTTLSLDGTSGECLELILCRVSRSRCGSVWGC